MNRAGPLAAPGPSPPLAEQRHLRRGALGLLVEHRADRSDQAGAACIDGVEGAGADQRFDRAAVDLVDAPAEVEEIVETAVLARGDDRLHGRISRP